MELACLRLGLRGYSSKTEGRKDRPGLTVCVPRGTHTCMSEKQPNWNAHGEVVVLEVLIQFCRSKVGELNFKEVADRNLRVKKKSERRKGHDVCISSYWQ